MTSENITVPTQLSPVLRVYYEKFFCSRFYDNGMPETARALCAFLALGYGIVQDGENQRWVAPCVCGRDCKHQPVSATKLTAYFTPKEDIKENIYAEIGKAIGRLIESHHDE
jgi:hypothetical protein